MCGIISTNGTQRVPCAEGAKFCITKLFVDDYHHSKTAEAVLCRWKRHCKPNRACGYGIITSRREPRPCKASLWTPERTFYHNLGLSPLRLRRSLHFAQLNCGIINATATVFIENRWPHNCGQLKCKHFSVAFLLSSSGSAGAELRRMNPPSNF